MIDSILTLPFDVVSSLDLVCRHPYGFSSQQILLRYRQSGRQSTVEVLSLPPAYRQSKCKSPRERMLRAIHNAESCFWAKPTLQQVLHEFWEHVHQKRSHYWEFFEVRSRRLTDCQYLYSKHNCPFSAYISKFLNSQTTADFGHGDVWRQDASLRSEQPAGATCR